MWLLERPTGILLQRHALDTHDPPNTPLAVSRYRTPRTDLRTSILFLTRLFLQVAHSRCRFLANRAPSQLQYSKTKQVECLPAARREMTTHAVPSTQARTNHTDHREANTRPPEHHHEHQYPRARMRESKDDLCCCKGPQPSRSAPRSHGEEPNLTVSSWNLQAWTTRQSSRSFPEVLHCYHHIILNLNPLVPSDTHSPPQKTTTKTT